MQFQNRGVLRCGRSLDSGIRTIRCTSTHADLVRIRVIIDIAIPAHLLLSNLFLLFLVPVS